MKILKRILTKLILSLNTKRKNSYGIKNRNDTTRIQKNGVKNIAECNLLHDIINHPKRAKSFNIHDSPILHGCMNTRKGKAKLKNFHIILDSGCSSKIVMGRLIDITTNLKVEIDFTLPAFSATNVVTWNCHVDDSTKGR